mmetsp:Transcript_40383/g.67659  ORF Transcript_40383/g.67659 Transcript_40383/m.67659 type:complete len:115 (-) Transcript_40383:153-497(-)
MEGCVQEVGRGGRDGKRSDCLILFSAKDVNSTTSKQDRKETSEEADVKSTNKLSIVQRFCQNLRECRNVMILKHFGERAPKGFGKKGSGICDVCSNVDSGISKTKSVPKSKTQG